MLMAAASWLLGARFSIEHVGKVVRVTDPQIAPDGKTIAVVVSRTNFEENRYDPELVLIDVTTHAQRALTRDRRGLSQPRWSPDGSQLAFLANVDGKPQIFVLPMGGGEAWHFRPRFGTTLVRGQAATPWRVWRHSKSVDSSTPPGWRFQAGLTAAI
jgi:dipeptidyl aminopeptidase/acylaminoacyl peptidase